MGKKLEVKFVNINYSLWGINIKEKIGRS